MSLIFEGNACTRESGGLKSRQSLFVPVDAGEDRGLDFVPVNSGKFWTTRALFRIEGDTLTIKEGAIERPRSTDLQADELALSLITGDKPDEPKEWAPVRVYKRRVK